VALDDHPGAVAQNAYIYADWGIRCNVIQPGFIETDMTQGMTSNVVVRKMAEQTMSNTVLLRRSGKAEEITYTALFLASDESSYITGTDIVVDGGWFSSAPYLGNERSHHMLSLLHKKEALEEKKPDEGSAVPNAALSGADVGGRRVAEPDVGAPPGAPWGLRVVTAGADGVRTRAWRSGRGV
jgi:hypothetical protein